MNTTFTIFLIILGTILISVTIYTVIEIKRHGIRPPEEYKCRYMSVRILRRIREKATQP